MSINVRDKTYTGDFSEVALTELQISTLRSIVEAEGHHLPYDKLGKDAATYLCRSGVDMAYKKMYKSFNGQQIYSVFSTSRGDAYIQYIDSREKYICDTEANRRSDKRVDIAIAIAAIVIPALLGVPSAIAGIRDLYSQSPPTPAEYSVHDHHEETEDNDPPGDEYASTDPSGEASE